MRVMEVNRKGWTAQCVDITGRSLQGDGKEGEWLCTPLCNLHKGHWLHGGQGSFSITCGASTILSSSTITYGCK